MTQGYAHLLNYYRLSNFLLKSVPMCLTDGIVIHFLSSSGNYFASHFFMGGEKFDTPHPEGYLFGENMDLNFLGNRPVQVTNYVLLPSLVCIFKSKCLYISFATVALKYFSSIHSICCHFTSFRM